SNDYIRMKLANDANEVGQNVLLAPDFQRLFVVFREAKIDCAREELASTINVTSSEKLLSASDSELLADIWTENVLTAIATCHRHVGGAEVASSRHVCQQLGVLIIRVRCHVEHASHLTKTLEFVKDRRRIQRLGFHLHLGHCCRNGRRGAEQHATE